MPHSFLSVLLNQLLYCDLSATVVVVAVSKNNVNTMVDDGVSHARENTEVKVVKTENELEATAADSGPCGPTKDSRYLGVRRGWNTQVS